MSRIFDALQRSGTEQSGVEYPDMVSMATAVFESSPLVAQSPALDVLGAEIQPAPEQETDAEAAEEHASVPAVFPSLEVSVTPSSLLVFFTQPESLDTKNFLFLGVRLRQIRKNLPIKKVLNTSTTPKEGKSLVIGRPHV